MLHKQIKQKRARAIDTELARTALSQLLIVEAAQFRPVVLFRKEVLGGELMKSFEVPAWVEAQHERDRTPAALKPAHRLGTVEELHFEQPGSQRLGISPVFPGGVLDRLRFVSKQLADRYGWKLAVATTFILTGAAPSVAGIRIEISKNSRYTRLNRITLVIDPCTGPREVLKAYGEVRAWFIRQRTRRIGTKSCLIVLFHLEQIAKNPRITWREEMELWNTKYRNRPDFRIGQETNYAKRYKDAVRNLLVVPSRSIEEVE